MHPPLCFWGKCTEAKWEEKDYFSVLSVRFCAKIIEKAVKQEYNIRS